jgi:3-deoxy-manno-octulosonate cytidylyltransferase (CMP-KDO synthetase)
MQAIVLIPARFASTRLPGKVLEPIQGKPMVWHVAERAIAANVGPVVITTDHAQVAATCTELGLMTAMTNSAHPSGTDRIGEALDRIDPRRHYEIVVNVQADVPMIDPEHIRMLADTTHDMATLCAIEQNEEKAASPHMVKVIASPYPYSGRRQKMRAHYFTRALPWGRGDYYHHIGVYGYHRMILDRLRRLPVGVLERREGLEQLRAIENGIPIDCFVVDDPGISVDTQADLDRARRIMEGRTDESSDVHSNDQKGGGKRP